MLCGKMPFDPCTEWRTEKPTLDFSRAFYFDVVSDECKCCISCCVARCLSIPVQSGGQRNPHLTSLAPSILMSSVTSASVVFHVVWQDAFRSLYRVEDRET